MTSFLSRWFRRDEPTLVQQMRMLWRVPADFTVPTSTSPARVVPPKPQTLEQWRQQHDRRSA